jgi:16S rRNA processing protein RimM
VRARVSASGPDLRAGRIGRAHGLDGSFYVTGALARLLTEGASVVVGGRTLAIVRRAGTEQRPIIRLEGISDRDAAEALRGSELTVPAQAAPTLAPGEWWAHELEGCVVADGGRRIGTVSRLIELPSCEALEVVREGSGERLLVPMVKDAVRDVDIDAREIDIDSGFLDLREEAPHGRGAGGDGA